MSKSELFTKITKKNALRRSSGLPLLDVRAEIAREEHQERANHYHTGYALHQDEYIRLKQQFLDDHLATTGCSFGLNSISAMRIHMEILPAYNEFLAARGYPFPGSPNPIIYGSDRS